MSLPPHINGNVRPRIIVLCGSTKFKDAFNDANAHLTLQGNLVISVGLFGHAEAWFFSQHTKRQLDDLHKRKIDLADLVYVINVGGYIGDSTRSEIEYARAHGIGVAYLEPPMSEEEENRVRGVFGP